MNPSIMHNRDAKITVALTRTEDGEIVISIASAFKPTGQQMLDGKYEDQWMRRRGYQMAKGRLAGALEDGYIAMWNDPKLSRPRADKEKPRRMVFILGVKPKVDFKESIEKPVWGNLKKLSRNRRSITSFLHACRYSIFGGKQKKEKNNNIATVVEGVAI